MSKGIKANYIAEFLHATAQLAQQQQQQAFLDAAVVDAATAAAKAVRRSDGFGIVPGMPGSYSPPSAGIPTPFAAPSSGVSAQRGGSLALGVGGSAEPKGMFEPSSDVAAWTWGASADDLEEGGSHVPVPAMVHL